MLGFKGRFKLFYIGEGGAEITAGSTSSVLWSGKPYLVKTIVKALIIYTLISIVLSPLFILVPLLFIAWTVFVAVFLVFYLYNKRAYTYYLTPKTIRIVKSWVFGAYAREITFDQIRDVHVFQGMLARLFKCGSVTFVTTTGLEVGYTGVGVGRRIRGGVITPIVFKYRGDMFWDVKDPHPIRERVVNLLVEWREVYQQQKIALAVEKIAEKAVSTTPTPQEDIVIKLEKLKKLLDEGAITREEYEKLKKKILEA